VHKAGTPRAKNAVSDPTDARIDSMSAIVNPSESIRSAARRSPAASVLAPPRPASEGMRFTRRIRRGGTRRARRSAFKARRTVFSGPGGAAPAGSISRESRRAGSTVIVSNRVTGAITVARSW
jgi:hypothetical protein